MARPRTATKILDARGAFKKDPQRARPDEPATTLAFRKTAPKHLDPEVRKCWREIVDRAPKGVLSGHDELLVELAARLLHESRTNFTGMPTARLTQLRVALERLGLSPSGRANLSVEKPKDSGFDDV